MVKLPHKYESLLKQVERVERMKKMRKMKVRQWISGLLCILFCISLIPAKAEAAEVSSVMIAGKDIVKEPDMTMELGEGTAEYDPATNTLTLTNATVTGEGSTNTDGVISFAGDLTIRLVGKNTITSDSCSGIRSSQGNMTIEGNGSLTIRSLYYGIRAGSHGNVSINGAVLDIESKSNESFTGNGIHAEGILEITESTVTVTEKMSNVTGLIGNGGISIKDSKVTADILSETGYNYALISDADISIDHSVVTANNMTKDSSAAINGGNVKIFNGSDVTAYSASANAIYAFDYSNSGISTCIEVKDSKFTSQSFYPGLAADDIILENSTAKVESTASNGISAGKDLTIKGNSDITSIGVKKALNAKNTIKLIPAEGQSMDVLAGTSAEDAKAIENSPFSQETDLTAYGNNSIKYFRSALHNHVWGDWKSNGDDTHVRTCSNCPATEKESCVGGTATCSEKAVCEICGGGHGKVDPSNHTNLVKKEAKPATNSEEGNIECWYCDGCNKYFSDEAGTKEISAKDVVIPKLKGNTDAPKTSSKAAAKTGDNSSLALWMIAMMAAGTVLAGTALYNRKKNYNS